MAGGIGSRFWPFSRTNNPKQFQDILGTGKTLIQQTIARFDGVCPKENIYIVTNQDYFGIVKEQLPFLADDQILTEPIMRNTAPCIAYACCKINAKNPHANIVVAPADHVITKPDVFKEVIITALSHTAQYDVLVTIGITPSRPDTGYGYIQLESDTERFPKVGELTPIRLFTEKPNLELAKEFLESGDFLWNAGIFIWNVKTILNKFLKHLPEVYAYFDQIKDKYYTSEENQAVANAYYHVRSISIDYGIMETADDKYVLPSEFGWSDLGTWKSLHELSQKDANGNAIQGDVITYETSNTIIKTPKERLVIVQGLENFIVAEYDNVLLICEKDQEQRIKDFVKDVKDSRGNKYN
jgi:mannose-1-phosphate guanylyltransferase